MITEINQLWVTWTGKHTIEEAGAMVARHTDAFTIVNFVNKGLVTPTETAYVLLRALKGDISA